MAASDTPAKKIPLLSFICFLQTKWFRCRDACIARAALYPIHEPAIFRRCVGDENDSNGFAPL
jgi:hypothetical protein